MNKIAPAAQEWRGLIFWPIVAPLLVACVPGAVVVSVLLHQADELTAAFLAGQLGDEKSIFLAASASAGALAAAGCYRLFRTARGLARLPAAAGCGLAAAAVAAGIVFWLGLGLGGRLVMLSAQVFLSLILLRAGRRAWSVMTTFRERSVLAVRRFALGAAGSLVSAALAGAVALGRGLELSLLARPHWFYVLVVPAVASFGLITAQPSVPSKLFNVLASLVVLLTISYSFGTVLFGAPEIVCDMHIYNPHYEVLGFDWEPWHWNQREGWRWVFAPGALTELSILHVFDPVPNLKASTGAYCAS